MSDLRTDELTAYEQGRAKGRQEEYDKCAAVRAREEVLVEALTETGRTCDFLRSIILSGEGWSEAARASYDETHGLRQRALATISDDSE